MLSSIKQALAVTLQSTVQSLGFMPDKCGHQVREVLASDDGPALLALGCYLDDSKKSKSYEPLKDGLMKIRLSQSQDRERARLKKKLDKL